MRKLPAICLLFLFGYGVKCQVPAANIPAFSFSKMDHSSFTREQLPKDKLTFFIFFDLGCDHCRTAIQYLDAHHTELNRINLYLLTLDDLSRASVFLKNYGRHIFQKPNALLLRDSRSEFIQKFGPRKYPSLFLYAASKQLLLYNDDPGALPVFLRKIKEKTGTAN